MACDSLYGTCCISSTSDNNVGAHNDLLIGPSVNSDKVLWCSSSLNVHNFFQHGKLRGLQRGRKYFTAGHAADVSFQHPAKISNGSAAF